MCYFFMCLMATMVIGLEELGVAYYLIFLILFIEKSINDVTQLDFFLSILGWCILLLFMWRR